MVRVWRQATRKGLWLAICHVRTASICESSKLLARFLDKTGLLNEPCINGYILARDPLNTFFIWWKQETLLSGNVSMRESSVALIPQASILFSQETISKLHSVKRDFWGDGSDVSPFCWARIETSKFIYEASGEEICTVSNTDPSVTARTFSVP